jgi:hypothetical protein
MTYISNKVLYVIKIKQNTSHSTMTSTPFTSTPNIPAHYYLFPKFYMHILASGKTGCKGRSNQSHYTTKGLNMYGGGCESGKAQ